jgi:hypothetical protein
MCIMGRYYIGKKPCSSQPDSLPLNQQMDTLQNRRDRNSLQKERQPELYAISFAYPPKNMSELTLPILNAWL